MPYITRCPNGKICSIMLNPIDENTEFLEDNDQELLFFSTRLQKLHDLDQELESRGKTVTVDSIAWDLTGPFSRMFAVKLMNAYDDAVTTVNLPDAMGGLHAYSSAGSKTLSAQITAYADNLYGRYGYLKTMISMATTLPEIQAIDVTSGWPAGS